MHIIMKVSVRFSSSIFYTCVCVWLPEETLKQKEKIGLPTSLIECFCS